jgi:hypothetical protein
MTIVHALDWLATATCVAALVILGVYASDRAPPFAVQHVVTPSGFAGQDVAFHAQVWRDRSRQCSAERFASAYHSDGMRTDYPTQFFTAAQIDHQEEKTPGRMAPVFRLPDNAQPGPGYILLTLHYRCNQAHAWFKPIEVQHVLHFTVMSP